MTIFCKICGHKIQSGKPAAEAQKDVLAQMSNHLGNHQAQAAELAKQIEVAKTLLALYLLMKKYVRIPNDESDLLNSYDQVEGNLIDLFALEPAESKPAN